MRTGTVIACSPVIAKNRKMKHIVRGFEYNSIRDALERSSVLTISQTSSGFVLSEGCDEWFRVCLSPDQLRAFAAELVSLAGEVGQNTAQSK